MNKTKTQPLIIEGQEIPGSFFGKLVKRLGIHGAHKALFKARNAKNILRYCSKGLREGWITQYSIEMEYETKVMLQWIDETFLKIKPEPVRVKKVEGIMKDGKIQRPDLPGIGSILKDLGI